MLHIYRTWTPSLLPGNYGFDRLARALLSEGEDLGVFGEGKSNPFGVTTRNFFGENEPLRTAIASSLLGVKVRHINPTRELGFRILELNATRLNLVASAKSIAKHRGIDSKKKAEQIEKIRLKVEKVDSDLRYLKTGKRE